MISKDAIQNTIISALQNKTDDNDPQGSLANALRDYFQGNLKVEGMYSGVLPVGSPDPLNGFYVFDTLPMLLTGSALKSAASRGYKGWFTEIMNQLRAIKINPIKPPITVTVTPISVNLFKLGMPAISNLTQFDEIVSIIADKIVSNLFVSPNAIAFPAVSSGGGVGTISFRRYV